MLESSHQRAHGEGNGRATFYMGQFLGRTRSINNHDVYIFWRNNVPHEHENLALFKKIQAFCSWQNLETDAVDFFYDLSHSRYNNPTYLSIAQTLFCTRGSTQSSTTLTPLSLKFSLKRN